MLKKFNSFLLIAGLLLQTMARSSSLIMDMQAPYNLAAIKEQVVNVKLEPFTFYSFQDETKKHQFKRHGFVVRRDQALGTVVICHGYLGCKQDALALKHLFPLYNVVVFDFRAHGQDRQGQFSTIGRDEAFDVVGVVNHVKSDPAMKDKPVIAFGFSMGAVSAIEAQAKDSSLFDAMILDCPYDSTDDAMRRGLEEKMKFSLFGKNFNIPGKQFLLDHMYDSFAEMITNFLFRRIAVLDCNKVSTKFVRVTPVESIKKVTVPCFFIHCENDAKVPILAVEKIYENKPGFKRLWITQGKRHFGSYLYNPELYWYKINKFLAKWQARDIDSREQEKVCDQRTKIDIDIKNREIGVGT